MKKTSWIWLAAAGSLVAVAAQAEDASPLTANISLTTNYKYRGQDQGENKPAIQGGFDYSKDGFYVGNWNASVKQGNASIEMDFYGGYKGEISKDFGYDVGILQYYYPQKNKTVELNTTELYGGLSFGPVVGKLSYTAGNKYFGVPNSRGTLYFDLAFNQEVAKSLTLNAHVGSTTFKSQPRNAGLVKNYYDYKLGLTYDLGSGFAAAGAVVGANKKDFYGDINKARVILTLTKSM